MHTDQAQTDRNNKGRIGRLAGARRAVLHEGHVVGLLGCIVDPACCELRRSGLAVPAFELGQQSRQVRLGVGVRYGLGKVVAGHGLAVVALEIQLHAPRKAGAAAVLRALGGQGLHHAHDFGAFFVHGDAVEVVDFHIAVRAHWVGHGAGVFGELHGAQEPYVFNAFDGAGRGIGAQVLAELLVPKNRQAFFEAELEPVAAGHAVAGPVVEILMAHHAFDVGVIGIGGRGRVGQQQLGVKDVQALVFHSAHIEVAGGHNHEALQVQRQAKARLVPGHRGHERMHGVLGFVQIARAHPHLQQVLAAAGDADALLAAHQLPGHQCKQIGRFFVRVHPFGKVASVFQRSGIDQIAVGQQHRKQRLVRTQGHGVAGHDIGAVQKVGDAPKALGLALREKRLVAHVQAH